MTPTIEYSEMIHKFEPWLNEKRDWSESYVVRGLKPDAPQKARDAYEVFLADETRRREKGLR